MRQGVQAYGEVKAIGKPILRNRFGGQGGGIKVPLIMCLQPEAGRSNPGQDEVPHQWDGGPLPVLSSTCSGDLGIEVKCQSS